MKISEWLRTYQISGKVPEAPKGDDNIAFWAGWLIGNGSRIDLGTSEEHIELGL